jgi:hypothetical protein
MLKNQRPRQGERFSVILHAIRDQVQGQGEGQGDVNDKATERNSDAVSRRPQGEDMTLGKLLVLFGPKSHSIVVLFLTLPFLQPVPLPGLSTAFGLTIAMVGFFMLIDRPPWIPQRLSALRLDPALVLKIASGLESSVRRIEHLIRPRGQSLIALAWFQRINGLVLCLHALILALPLPIPFSNFFPASVLLLIALGSLEEDAYVIAAGYAAALINAVYFSALIVLPALSMQMMR